VVYPIIPFGSHLDFTRMLAYSDYGGYRNSIDPNHAVAAS